MDGHRLSPQEQALLDALEAGLGQEDPEFVARFGDASRSLDRSAMWPRDVLSRWLRRRSDET